MKYNLKIYPDEKNNISTYLCTDDNKLRKPVS